MIKDYEFNNFRACVRARLEGVQEDLRDLNAKIEEFKHDKAETEIKLHHLFAVLGEAVERKKLERWASEAKRKKRALQRFWRAKQNQIANHIVKHVAAKSLRECRRIRCTKAHSKGTTKKRTRTMMRSSRHEP